MTAPVDIARLDVRPDTGALHVHHYALINVKTGNVPEITDCVKLVSQVIGEFIVTIHAHHFVTKIYAINLMVGVVKVASWEGMVTHATKRVVQGVYTGHVTHKVHHALRDVIKIGWELDAIVCIDFFSVFINKKKQKQKNPKETKQKNIYPTNVKHIESIFLKSVSIYLTQVINQQCRHYS